MYSLVLILEEFDSRPRYASPVNPLVSSTGLLTPITVLCDTNPRGVIQAGVASPYYSLPDSRIVAQSYNTCFCVTNSSNAFVGYPIVSVAGQPISSTFVFNAGPGFIMPLNVLSPDLCESSTGESVKCLSSPHTKGQQPSLIRKKHRIRKNFERHTKQRILSMYVQLLKQDPNTTVRCIATTIFNQMKKES